MKHPGRNPWPIKSAVERLLLVIEPAVHDHRWSAPHRAPVPGSADLEAELARDRDKFHELRATVGGLVASYELLQEHQAELTPATRSRLEHLHEAELERLERLLADQPTGLLGPVDLGLVIDQMVEMLRLRGHEITWSGTSLRAWGCQDDAAQVVHVLLDNAIRHAYGNEVEVAVVSQGVNVEVRVHDLGPGVAPEMRSDLFERGVRGAGSSGEGIGLDIAHRLADQMDADLRLEPGVVDAPGATFVLSLPAMPGAADDLSALA